MKTVRDIAEFLEALAPCRLAEDWDNVGLLVGDPAGQAQRVMTCLTVTPDSADEAVERGAQLIVTHHPLPFRPLKRITTDTTPGRLLWQLIRQGISIYSPHTAFDSAAEGINQQLAEAVGLGEILPLVPTEDDSRLGSGRYGTLSEPVSLKEIASRLGDWLEQDALRGVPAENDAIHSVAVACGAAGQFIEQARDNECQLLITGETSFHTCLEAAACGMGLLLIGHFASERFAVVNLATRMAQAFPALEVWASECEKDPLEILLRT